VPSKFGHGLEFHAIDAGNEGERSNDSGQDGHYFHHLVQPIADTGSNGLGDGIPWVAQPLRAVEQQSTISAMSWKPLSASSTRS
jgi:hypothetical protein